MDRLRVRRILRDESRLHGWDSSFFLRSLRHVVSSSMSESRWQLALVFLIPVCAQSALLNFAPLLPRVQAEYSLTNMWGGLLASAAIVAHTLLQLPGGQIVDSLGAKRSIALGLAVIAGSVLGCAAAPSLPLLFACRFITGLGTATAFVGGLAFVNAAIGVESRGVVQGVYGASAMLGTLLVLLFSERLASFGGWRGTFALEGCSILLVAGLALLLKGSARMASRGVTSWREILSIKPLYLLGLAHILTYGVNSAISTWVTTFLWRVYGIGLELAGPLAALLAVSAVVGRGLGGFLSKGRDRSVILVSCGATAACAAVLGTVPGLWAVLVGFVAIGWFSAVPFGSVFSYASLVAEKGATGRGLSVINFVANVGASILPPLIGYALDETGSFIYGFGAVSLIGFAGTLTLLVFLPRPRRA